MLVLGRTEGQRILIGQDIVVTVVRIDGGKVRIGVEAPRDVTVFREELAHGAASRPASMPLASDDAPAKPLLAGCGA